MATAAEITEVRVNICDPDGDLVDDGYIGDKIDEGGVVYATIECLRVKLSCLVTALKRNISGQESEEWQSLQAQKDSIKFLIEDWKEKLNSDVTGCFISSVKPALPEV